MPPLDRAQLIGELVVIWIGVNFALLEALAQCPVVFRSGVDEALFVDGCLAAVVPSAAATRSVTWISPPLYVKRPLRNVQNGSRSASEVGRPKGAFARHRHCGCAEGPPRRYQRPQPASVEQPLLQPEVHSG